MFQSYRGHSSHVTRVRFTNDHRFLISTGGADKCIIQWRHDVEELESDSQEELDPVADAADVVYFDDVKLHRTPLHVSRVKCITLCNRAHSVRPQDAVNNSKTSTELMELAKPSSGDEFMAVKPWLGALVPPSWGGNAKAEASTDVDLQLSWVHGFRAKGRPASVSSCCAIQGGTAD
jgi:hypothetical protein